ncbi:hypothetical protein [Lysinibacillus sp. FJAT-14745]|uniref:hypothetical protein n=1 Tax=Lysinibacillus sp. FJAT-14745 TaxID=1704289 RepID=UPI000ABCA97C|nr:hypothetical protein [Lysinibacillus sp. FJAT-14745]
MPYLRIRGTYKNNSFTEQKDSNINRTSKKDQEAIKNVNKILEESKTSKLSAKQIETLKTAARSGLLNPKSNELGSLGMYNLQKGLKNTKFSATMKAYKSSI